MCADDDATWRQMKGSEEKVRVSRRHFLLTETRRDVRLMKCAEEEGAEETFIPTQFINRRSPPQSCSCLSCLFELHRHVARQVRGKESNSGSKAGIFKMPPSQRSKIRSSETHTHIQAQNPCMDAELQWRSFFRDERLSLKCSVGPGGDSKFEKETKKKGGRGMKR